MDIGKELADVEPVVISDSDDESGSGGIEQRLVDFAAHVNQRSPEKDVTKLPRPYVLGAVWPIESADIGMGDRMVWQPDDGVMVVIPLATGTSVGSQVFVHWNGQSDTLVGARTVKQVDVDNRYIACQVPSNRVMSGSGALYYRIREKQGLPFSTSAQTSTLVRYGQPGHLGNSKPGMLPAPVVAPASGVFDVKSSVTVQIPVYPNINLFDVIYVYWGDEEIAYTVKNTDLTASFISIVVPEGTLAAAGDSDQLPVYYYICDEVMNESEWSDDAYMAVDITHSGLQAPAIVDPRDPESNQTVNEIDVDVAAGLDVVIKVDTVGNFQLNDAVKLLFTGRTAAGYVSNLELGPLAVTVLGRTLRFSVPAAEIAKLAGGSGTAKYMIQRGSSQLTSKDSYVDIKGTLPNDLPPPAVLKKDQARWVDVDSWVDAECTTLRVVIPVEADLRQGNQVSVILRGTRPDGSPLLTEIKKYTVSANQEKKPLAVMLDGKRTIKPLDGGFAEISYFVIKGKSRRESERYSLDIGYLQETLPAPDADPQLSNGVLDPQDDMFAAGVDIVIPALSSMTPPCKVTLVWETTAGGYYEDELNVTDVNVTPAFQVPESELEVTGYQPVEVTVYYVVSQDGKPDVASADLTFKIATSTMLIPTVSVNQGVMRINGGAQEVFQQRGSVFAPAGWSVKPGYKPPSQQRLPDHGLPPFTYRSSDDSVATVSGDGTVTARKNGSVEIYITDARKQEASYRVEVEGCFNFYFVEGACNLVQADAWWANHGLKYFKNAEFYKLLEKFAGPLPITKHSWCERVGADLGVFYHLNYKKPGIYANTYNPDVKGVLGVKSA